jgi:hypothetical protein
MSHLAALCCRLGKLPLLQVGCRQVEPAALLQLARAGQLTAAAAGGRRGRHRVVTTRQRLRLVLDGRGVVNSGRVLVNRAAQVAGLVSGVALVLVLDGGSQLCRVDIKRVGGSGW